MAIELVDLGHTYGIGTPHEVQALADLNLTIAEGEFLGIIGPTGSGKSTLAQCLIGLIKPTAGRVLVDGRDITTREARRNLKWLRQKIGMVFQFPEHQLFEETVLADVAFGPRNLGLTSEEAAVRARTALGAVGLGADDEIAARSPFALSGGQMRRVAIAGVLAMEPEVLLLDEPAAGLDPQGRAEILDQITQLHRTRRLTVILVSHNMEEIARLTDRLLVLAEGRLLMDAPPVEVFGRGAELRALGLDVPLTVQVLEQLRGLGWQVPLSARDEVETAAAIAAALPLRRAALRRDDGGAAGC